MYIQEFKKINYFYEYKLMEITKRWLEIKFNCIAIIKLDDTAKKNQMKTILTLIYQEISLLI